MDTRFAAPVDPAARRPRAPQGVYMLQDNRHRLLARCSPAAEKEADAKQVGLLHAKFPSGLIRGALHGLGVLAAVGVEVTDLCACQFTIKIQQQPPEAAKGGPV